MKDLHEVEGLVRDDVPEGTGDGRKIGYAKYESRVVKVDDVALRLCIWLVPTNRVTPRGPRTVNVTENFLPALTVAGAEMAVMRAEQVKARNRRERK